MVYKPTEEDRRNPCMKCDGIYDGENDMIQCDACDDWIHVECAGLEQTPMECEEFFCYKCVQLAQINQSRPTRKMRKRAVKTSFTIDGSSSLENQPSIATISFEKTDGGAQLANILKRLQIMEAKLDQQTTEAKRESQEFQRKLAEKDNQIVQQRREIESLSACLGQNVNDIEGTKAFPQKASENLNRTGTIKKIIPVSSPVKLRDQRVEVSDTEEENSENELPRTFGSKESQILNSTSTEKRRKTQAFGMDPSRFMIKQSLRKLPIFDGQCRDWPRFVSAYKYSTKHGPFSAEENTNRLSEFLKGDALRLVEGFLINPSASDDAMETLEEWYGDTHDVKNELKNEILKLPRPDEKKKDTIRDFATQVRTFVKYLEVLPDNKYHLCNEDTILELLRMLPPGMQARWFDLVDIMQARPTLQSFEKFVSRIAKSYKNVVTDEPENNNKFNGRMKSHRLNLHTETSEGNHDGSKNSNEIETKLEYCHYCRKTGHTLENCDNFKQLRQAKRFEIVKSKYICYTCFRKGHNWNSCRFNKGKPKPEVHPLIKREENVDGNSSTEISLNHYDSSGKRIIFRVVPIVIYGPRKNLQTYAILDDCSSITLIDRSVVHELDLQVTDRDVPLNLQWTQGKSSNLKCDKVSLNLSGNGLQSRKYKLKNVYSMENLNLPPQSLDVKKLKERYPYLADASLKSLKQAKPMILLGLEHTNLGLPLQVKQGGFSKPVAFKTRLGWTIQGPDFHESEGRNHKTFLMCQCEKEDDDLHELVKYNFTTESFGIKPPGPTLESTQESRARKLLEDSAIRNGRRFKVPMLWINDEVELPDSLPMAMWRLECLERKLAKTPELLKQYSERIKEYCEKDYAFKVSPENIQSANRIWYIPHFPVFNINKPGKLRLVFDAAACVLKRSLNSYLLSGPDVYNQLVLVLLRQRLFAIAVTGDIQEMFHQIEINEADQAAQRFLWRDGNSTEKPKVYQMKRMIFGATSSPFIAQWVKNKNANEFKSAFPEAYEAIVDGHYVDDFIDSFTTEEDAVRITLDVKNVHAKAGFNLRNFVSNSKIVENTLNGEKEVVEVVDLDKENPQQTEKVLGMHWCTASDEYVFKTNYVERLKISSNRNPTKREFLRTLMSIFDPFGLLANYIIHGKILLQDIWVTKIGWDQELQNNEFEKYGKWISELPKIEDFRLARCLSFGVPSADNVQLHVFSDASESAFAAVVYLRVRNGDSIDVRLVGAKSRVAPTRKTLSIPRLELQGFILGIRWTKFLMEGLQRININQIVHWCDSKTVIAWINSTHRKYNRFVEHRISEAIEYFEEFKQALTRYVPSNLNVADEATKWTKPIDVSPTSVWVNGPDFIKKEESMWPINVKCEEVNEESKIVYLHKLSQRHQVVEFTNFSSYRRILRCMAWVFRYYSNLRRKSNKTKLVKNKWLSSEELEAARQYLIQQAQQECFPEELQILQNEEEKIGDKDKILQKALPASSEIFKLSPIKVNDVLRVGGRIQAADYLSFDTKFPIILKKNHPFTNLVLDEYHKIYAHQHLETCVNEIRQKYWVTDLRVCVKQARKRCQECKIRLAMPRAPQMGNLPAARMTPFVPPFTYTGMDLFGPVDIIIGRAVHKRWVVLYTCLTTRAIHLEVVKDLSTDACIMAYRCFKSIRPKPKKIYCDNGTNFVGMVRELKMAWIEWKNNREKISAQTFDPKHVHQTEWCFIPPASPHMGGSWERMVRTVKNVLKIIVKNSRLHEDTLRCFLMETMDIVNSRPLTYLPLENGLDPALTPNTILKFSTSSDPPPGEFDENEFYVRKHWKYAQYLADQFWKRWVKEIIPDLTRRSKWYKKTTPLQVDDLVIIVDERAERNCWERGRIIRVYPEKNGQVRFADVKTKNGIYKRPAVKLAILDVS